MQKKIVGIIGGVGPAATAELFSKVVSLTKASCDSEHIHILIDNNPAIPDRTRAIKEGTKAPVKPVVDAGKGLIQMGADFLAIPCVTAHSFYDEILSGLSVPLLNIVEETAEFCKNSGYKKVGILATSGTCGMHIFDKALAKKGIAAVYPNEADQKTVMHIIYDMVKAGKPAEKELLCHCLESMKNQGVDAVILGCTELPLVLCQGDFGMKYIDVLEILAKAIIINAGYDYKE